MPPRNGNKESRSQSRGRGRRRGPQKTVPDSQADSSNGPQHSSPSLDQPLPLDNQNKSPLDSVSTASASPIESTACNVKNSSSNDITPYSVENRDGISENLEGQTPDLSGGAPLGVSDNTALTMPETVPTLPPQPSDNLTIPQPSLTLSDGDPFDSTPEDSWHYAFTELKAMRSRMLSLEKLELNTQSFSQQLQELGSKTSNIENRITNNSLQLKDLSEENSSWKIKTEENYQQQQTFKEKASSTDTQVSNNSQQIKDLGEEILALKKVVQEQQQTISSLSQVRNDFKQDKDDFSKKSRKVVTEMNKLVDAQREQVESFRVIRNDVNRKCDQQEKQISQISHDVKHNSLKDKAFRKCNNIAILGLQEHESRSAFAVAVKFFKDDLKLKKLDIDVAYRIGQIPPNNSTYIRPLIVKFSKLSDRNAVWRRRNDVPQPEDLQPGQQRIRIQADLPRQLRDDVNILYKVARAASSTQEYKSAYIRDYALILDGKEYTARQLELLPQPLRPTSLAIKKNDNTLIFFSKFCELSNHFPSEFTCQNKTFSNVEHYLAFKRAELSQQQPLIEKALQATDPVEAKSILNSLRNDHEQEWQRDRFDTAKMGIKAKFSQNKLLSTYLLKTGGLQLGEASKNPCWEIGMTLEDQHAMDTGKWNQEGNLLGKILMQVREELKQDSGITNN